MNEKDFVFESSKLVDGSSSWESPSNIALIKYWGKHRNQLPKTHQSVLHYQDQKQLLRLDIDQKLIVIKRITLFYLIVLKRNYFMKKSISFFIELRNIFQLLKIIFLK